MSAVKPSSVAAAVAISFRLHNEHEQVQGLLPAGELSQPDIVDVWAWSWCSWRVVVPVFFWWMRLVKSCLFCVDQRRPKLISDLADEVRKERRKGPADLPMVACNGCYASVCWLMDARGSRRL